MLSQMNGAMLFFAQIRKTGLRSIQWTVICNKLIKALFTVTHYGLLVIGISTITTLGIVFFKPKLADRIKTLPPFVGAGTQAPVAKPVQPSFISLMGATSETEPVEPATEPEFAMLTINGMKNVGLPQQQQWVTSWLSRRYHVANDAANMLVSASYSSAKDTKLDPLLILAVMCIESGLNPFAESPMGAQGLMQVMSKVHHDKFNDLGGIKAALNPVANIRVGAMILRDLVAQGGSVEAGLKSYVGAAAFDNDAGYGSKVLTEYHRLQDVAAGKSVPVVFAPVITTAMKQQPHAPENSSTTKTDLQAGGQPALPDSAALEHDHASNATSGQFSTAS